VIVYLKKQLGKTAGIVGEKDTWKAIALVVRIRALALIQSHLFALFAMERGLHNDPARTGFKSARFILLDVLAKLACRSVFRINSYNGFNAYFWGEINARFHEGVMGMIKNQLIAKQQLEIETLKERVDECEEVLAAICMSLVNIGGPLNDNRLQFDVKQRAFLHEIHERIKDIL